ncbi:hypothetical protein ABH925_007043 [Streptacidiphilus sp. EB129]|jgi:hypothetical protein
MIGEEDPSTVEVSDGEGDWTTATPTWENFWSRAPIGSFLFGNLNGTEEQRDAAARVRRDVTEGRWRESDVR